MKVAETSGSRDPVYADGRVVHLLPDHPDNFFRVTVDGPDDDASTMFVGTEIHVRGMPEWVTRHLAHQPNTALLDMYLPPVPDRPRARHSGPYRFDLILGSRAINTRGVFEEFTAAN